RKKIVPSPNRGSLCYRAYKCARPHSSRFGVFAPRLLTLVVNGPTDPTELGSKIYNGQTTTRTRSAIASRSFAAGSRTPSKPDSRLNRATESILRIAGTPG